MPLFGMIQTGSGAEHTYIHKRPSNVVKTNSKQFKVYIFVKLKKKSEKSFQKVFPLFIEGLLYIYIYIYIYFISIIHPRCIREVFSDALSSSPISGYFCIISAPTVTPAWLWKSQAASVIATCYARASTKAKKKKKKTHKAGLIVICPSVNSHENRAFYTPLLYIIPSLPHPVSTGYFGFGAEVRCYFNTRSRPWFTLHKTYTNLPPNLSYTNTSKLTWIKPLLKTIQSVFNSYLIPLIEATTKKKKKKGKLSFIWL